MRSEPSSLLFSLGFVRTVIVGSYHTLIDGTSDAVDSHKAKPSWRNLIQNLAKALLFPLAFLGTLALSSVMTVLVGDGKSPPRSLLLKQLDGFDAKYLHR